MSRKHRYDDSWHQTELQWLEDGIHIWLEEIVRFVCSLFELICLIIRAMWVVGCFTGRALWAAGRMIAQKCN